MKINKVNKIINSIKDSDYFKQALTHSSYCHDNNFSPSDSYENLEFLGDSILNFQVSYFIFLNFPTFNEGKLSKLKQLMVQEGTLATLSKTIKLNQFLRLGTGEKKNGGMEKNSILADIFESFIAALYLNKGIKITQSFLQLTLFDWIKGKENLLWDYKSQLQELCQSEKNTVNYKLQNSIQKDNTILFIVNVSDKLNSFKAQGRGKNRKSAEQDAAYKILKQKKII